MKARFMVAAILTAALAVAASTTASGSVRTAKANSITVWLMGDAQSGWPNVVAEANAAFKAKHPGIDVKVEYQTWGDHLTKFDATIAGGNVPDVLEFGNSETTKYMASGALKQLKASSFPNSKTWLAGLRASCTFGGKLFCVPYYAGARAVIYRKDQYKSAGIKGTPRSQAQFLADGKKLMKKFGKSDPNYSAFYFAGKNWYASLAYVYDYGGQIATKKGGKWVGTLEKPAAIKGLTAAKNLVRALSRASKTTDEAHPQQSLVFAKGHVGSFIGNGWEWPYALNKDSGNPALANVVGAYPMPSHIKGKLMPEFLGGSDLAIPAQSKNASLAIDWVKAFTSTSAETGLAKVGNIPNTTKLANVNKDNPQLAPFAVAASSSWFVPTAPNWVNVENADVLQNMLVQIYTGNKSVIAAAKSADRQIEKILNG
jgi:N,N'-diacetylchitobiose transport system substrate-binding protein